MKHFSTKITIAGIFLLLAGAIGGFWFIGNASYNNLTYSETTYQDALSTYTSEDLETLATIATSTNTGRLAQKLAEGLAKSSAEGTDPTLIFTSDIFLEALAETEREFPRPTHYTKNDFKISVDTSGVALDFYGNEVAKIGVGAAHKDLGEEHRFMMESMRGSISKSDARAKIGVSKDSYKTISEKLTTLSVPKEKLDRHTKMTNTYLDLSYSTELMVAAIDDPLIGLIATKTYIEALTSLSEL